ncbi:MAG: lysostaphin resistance A-like protein, partial [Chitinophagaceae bacterium]
MALKVHNTLSAVGTWLLTAVFFVKFKQWDFRRMIAWNLPKQSIVWMPVLVIFAASIVISAYILSFTSQSQFLKDLEIKIGSPAIQGTISKMLQMENIGGLFINFFFIALVPAILEEIFFRGILQNLLMRATGSPHTGIAICSIVFASVHLNPTQFFPMVVLAMVLGYVMYYTNSLFCSIAVHFFNNALAVTAFY